jgi:hypothetical protein
LARALLAESEHYVAAVNRHGAPDRMHELRERYAAAVNQHSSPDWMHELRELYARVDALYADWSCPSSSDCCRFGITGRQPFVTALELSAIRHALERRGDAIESQGRPPRQTSAIESPRRRGLPVAHDASHERVCPLLDHEQRCSVYADRPFGCRSYYCGRAARGDGPAPDELRALLEELQSLAARYEVGGEHARPLLDMLERGFAG